MNNIPQKPMITTIIPTYRRPKLLRRAIRSVLNQTYPHFQACVYDNASGDETSAIVEEMARSDPRIKYYCHPENIGCTKNFNYGAEHVETPFFSLCSDDDVLLPEFYETALEGFAKFPDAAFSGGATIGMTDRGKITGCSMLGWGKTGYYPPPDGFSQMVKKGHPVWTGILFRKEVVKDVWPLIEEGMETDRYFLYRIAIRFPIVVSQKPCAILVVHSLSYSTLAQRNPVWLKESTKKPKLIEKLIEDERIPLDVRIRAEQALMEWFKKSMFRHGVRFVGQKMFDEAYKVADSLYNEHHMKIKAILLYVAIKVCQLFPQACYLGSYLNKIRKFFFLNKSFHKSLWKWQKEFGHYARFLKL